MVMACTIGVIWCVLIRAVLGGAVARKQLAQLPVGDAELAGQIGSVGAVELLHDLR